MRVESCSDLISDYVSIFASQWVVVFRVLADTGFLVMLTSEIASRGQGWRMIPGQSLCLRSARLRMGVTDPFPENCRRVMISAVAVVEVRAAEMCKRLVIKVFAALLVVFHLRKQVTCSIIRVFEIILRMAI